MAMDYHFDAELWEAGAAGSWVFLTVPHPVSEDLRELSGPRPGFGSVRVEVLLGSTRWRTSVFPDAKTGCFVLPVKKAVRHHEGVEVGDQVLVGLSLVDDEG